MALAQAFKSPLGYAIVAVLTAAASAMSWVGFPTVRDEHGRVIWLLSWFTMFVFSATAAFIALYRQKRKLEQRFEPKFTIVFLPEDHQENRPYLQVLKFQVRDPNPVQNRPLHLTMCDRRYRVGVRNLSAAIVPNVQVILAKCDPGSNWIHPAHRLLVMDSDPPVGERDLPTSPLSGEPTLFFDVVNELGDDDKVPNHFSFCFANPNLSQPILDADEYRITLRAQGGGWSEERLFTVKKKWDADSKKRQRLLLESL